MAGSKTTLTPAEEVEKFVGDLLGGVTGGDVSASNPTTTIVFKGPQTAGVLQSFKCPFDGDIVRISADNGTIISKGRSWTSLSATSWTGDNSVIAHIQNAAYTWVGRERIHAGDYIYLDSVAGLGTSSVALITVERRG
jgi:hypothetical protein